MSEETAEHRAVRALLSKAENDRIKSEADTERLRAYEQGIRVALCEVEKAQEKKEAKP